MQCTNSSRLLPDTTLNFIKTHPLMNNAVPATGGAPLLLHTSFKSVLTLCLYFSVSVPFSPPPPPPPLFLSLSLFLPPPPPPPPPFLSVGLLCCYHLFIKNIFVFVFLGCLFVYIIFSFYLLVSFPQRTCITPAFMNKQTKSPGIENTETTKAKAHASASKEKKKERERRSNRAKQMEQTVRFQPDNRKHPMRQVFETPLMSGVLWKPRVLLVNKQADGLEAYHD